MYARIVISEVMFDLHVGSDVVCNNQLFFWREGINLIDFKKLSNLFNAIFIAMNFIGAGDVTDKLSVQFAVYPWRLNF